MGVGFHEGENGEQIRERQEIGGLGDHNVVLQEDRHPDGADQGREARRLAQRLVGDLLDGEAVGGGVENGHDGGQDQDRYPRHPVHGEDGGDDERGEGSDHVDLAVGEIDQLDDPVNHRIAQRDQGVDAAPRESSDRQFQKIIHIRPRSETQDPLPLDGGGLGWG